LPWLAPQSTRRVDSDADGADAAGRQLLHHQQSAQVLFEAAGRREWLAPLLDRACTVLKLDRSID